MSLGEKIKNARKEAKLTQKQLATRLIDKGVKTTHGTISNWELDNTQPDIDTIALICQILNKPANYFINESPEVHSASSGEFDTSGLDTNDIKELEIFRDYLKSKKEI